MMKITQNFIIGIALISLLTLVTASKWEEISLDTGYGAFYSHPYDINSLICLTTNDSTTPGQLQIYDAKHGIIDSVNKQALSDDYGYCYLNQEQVYLNFGDTGEFIYLDSELPQESPSSEITTTTITPVSNLTSIPINEEVTYFGWKYTNKSNFIIKSPEVHHCVWDVRKDIKSCELIAQYEKFAKVAPGINDYSIIFEGIEKYSPTYYFSNQYIDYLEHWNETVNIHRERYYSHSNMALVSSIDTTNPFEIRAVFDMPKYDSESFNITLNGKIGLSPSSTALGLDPTVSACGTLNTENATYYLTQNITGVVGTCFIIDAANITLDLNGYTIDGDDTGSDYGVTSVYDDYVTIRNGTIRDFQRGIYTLSNYTTVHDITAYSNHDYGIQVNGQHCLITDCVADLNSDKGIYLYGNNITVTNSQAINTPGTTNPGVEIYAGSTNMVFINVTANENGYGFNLAGSNHLLVNCTSNENSWFGVGISSTYTTLLNHTSNFNKGNYNLLGASCTIRDSRSSLNTDSGSGGFRILSSNINITNVTSKSDATGFRFQSDSNVVIKEAKVRASTVYGIFNPYHATFINSSVLGSSSADITPGIEVFLVNVTYNKENVTAGRALYRQWHYKAYVNNTAGTPLSGVTITARNSTSDIDFTLETGADGYTPFGAITEYGNMSGVTQYYHNHTITASRPGYDDVVLSYNATAEQSIFKQVFTMGVTDATTPNIEWNWTDINSTISIESTTICVNASEDVNCTLNFNGTDYINSTQTQNVCFYIHNLHGGNYSTISATCDDVSDDTNTTTTAWLGVGVGTVTIDWTYPTSNISVEQNKTFYTTFEVCCLGGNCNNVNVSLDPIVPGCDIASSDCTNTCDEIFTPSTSGWSKVGAVCQSTTPNPNYKTQPDSFCDAQPGLSTNPNDGDCAYYINTFWPYYVCPSFQRKGGVVTSADCYCNGGGACQPFETYFDFSSIYFLGKKTGLVSTTPGDTPFYVTNSTNPRTITLSENECQNVTFWVNATGAVNLSHEFFGYANRTQQINLSAITSIWNITIIPADTTPPIISWNWTNVNSSNQSVSQNGICITANEAVNCTLNIDGIYQTNATSATDICFYNDSLSEANHTLFITCDDTSGNNASTTNAWLDINSSYVFSCGTLSVASKLYVLQNDLLNQPGTCLTITANNIILDLNNHTVDGVDSLSTFGVYINSATGVTVKNGLIQDFDYNIYASSSTSSKLYDLKLNSSITYGLMLFNSGSATIYNVSATGGGDTGLLMVQSNSNTISNSSFNQFNVGLQASFSSYNRLENVTTNSNNDGILLGSMTGNNVILNLTSLYNSDKAIEDTSGGSYSSTLVYNNSFGQINWTSSTFKQDMDVTGPLWLSNENLTISDNFVFVNGSALTGNINSSARINLYGVGDRGYNRPVIIRNDDKCLTCTNETPLTADTVIFTVEGFSNYSVGEDPTPIQVDWNWTNINSTSGSTSQNGICVNMSEAGTCTLNFNGTIQTNSTFNTDICFYNDSIASENHSIINVTCEDIYGYNGNTTNAWLYIDIDPPSMSIDINMTGTTWLEYNWTVDSGATITSIWLVENGTSLTWANCTEFGLIHDYKFLGLYDNTRYTMYLKARDSFGNYDVVGLSADTLNAGLTVQQNETLNELNQTSQETNSTVNAIWDYLRGTQNQTLQNIANWTRDTYTNMSILRSMLGNISDNQTYWFPYINATNFHILGNLSRFNESVQTRFDTLDTSVANLHNSVLEVGANVTSLTQSVHELSRNLSAMGVNITNIDLDIAEVARNLSKLDVNLSRIGNELSKNLSDINSSIGEMAFNITTIANSLGQLSGNLSSVSVNISKYSHNLSRQGEDIARNLSRIENTLLEVGANLTSLTLSNENWFTQLAINQTIMSQNIEQWFTKTNINLTLLDTKVENWATGIAKNLTILADSNEAWFTKTNINLTSLSSNVENWFTGLSENITYIKNNLSELNASIQVQLENAIGNLTAINRTLHNQINSVGANVTSLDAYTREQFAETAQNLTRIETSLNGLSANLTILANSVGELSHNLTYINTTLGEMSMNITSLTNVVETWFTGLSQNITEIKTNLSRLDIELSNEVGHVLGNLTSINTTTQNNLLSVGANLTLHDTQVQNTLGEMSSNLTTLGNSLASLGTNVSKLDSNLSNKIIELGQNITNAEGQIINQINKVGANITLMDASMESHFAEVARNLSYINNSILSVGGNITALANTIGELSANLTSFRTSTENWFTQIAINQTILEQMFGRFSHNLTALNNSMENWFTQTNINLTQLTSSVESWFTETNHNLTGFYNNLSAGQTDIRNDLEHVIGNLSSINASTINQINALGANLTLHDTTIQNILGEMSSNLSALGVNISGITIDFSDVANNLSKMDVNISKIMHNLSGIETDVETIINGSLWIQVFSNDIVHQGDNLTMYLNIWGVSGSVNATSVNLTLLDPLLNKQDGEMLNPTLTGVYNYGYATNTNLSAGIYTFGINVTYNSNIYNIRSTSFLKNINFTMTLTARDVTATGISCDMTVINDGVINGWFNYTIWHTNISNASYRHNSSQYDTGDVFLNVGDTTQITELFTTPYSNLAYCKGVIYPIATQQNASATHAFNITTATGGGSGSGGGNPSAALVAAQPDLVEDIIPEDPILWLMQHWYIPIGLLLLILVILYEKRRRDDDDKYLK